MDKFGRPIYSDVIWQEICRYGRNLLKIGYFETNQPNLFAKEVFIDGNKEKVYADLRGTKFTPIWKNPMPFIYFTLNFPESKRIIEIINLKRGGCNPRFYDLSPSHDNPYDPKKSAWLLLQNCSSKYEETHYIMVPDGYCRDCGKDILNSAQWEYIDHPIEEISKMNICLEFEFFYCEVCRKNQYRQMELDQNIEYTCELCGEIYSKCVIHHIRYDPEENIKICRPCHSLIH
ncbi:MAG: hypothetical protein ACP6IY_19010, partial [Promethearchaeia archaeon]